MNAVNAKGHKSIIIIAINNRPYPTRIIQALETLEDSPTEGLFKSMCILSEVATEEELFSDYKLFETSLRQLLGDETANTILTLLHDEVLK
jgi:hypothetical protein